jgi:nucleoside-triphosphatase
MAKTLLLTGRPGVGKTTIIRQVAALLGARAGGFYTQEMRGPGGRKGFRLVTLAGGPEAVIAHVHIRSRNRVGRYGVDVAALDAVGVAAIRKAIQSSEIIVVDEIGKMEMFSGEFRGAVLKAMSSDKTVVATVMQQNHDWILALKGMPQVTVWQVTESNRNEMPGRVMEWIKAGSDPHSGGPFPPR